MGSALVGEKVSFGVGPESDSRLHCLLAVTLGRFLDSQAFGLLLCSKGVATVPIS